MSITSNDELLGMQQISDVVAQVLKAMREHCKPGMSTKELDDFGGALLEAAGAKSAPKLTYNFPGYTCISIYFSPKNQIQMAFDLDMIKKVYDRYSTRVDAARKATGKHLTLTEKFYTPTFRRRCSKSIWPRVPTTLILHQTA
jgi:hypothetical protein